MKSHFQFRIRLFSFIIIALALLLMTRLYYLQVIHGDEFADKADRQYVRPSSYTFDRGNIFFTPKEGPLISAATVENGFTLAINPKELEMSGAELCQKLLPIILAIDCADVTSKADKDKDPYEELAKRLTADQAKAIQELKITGVGLYKDRWRIYPGDTLAAHVLGFVGYKGDELEGRYGLEAFYEKTLKRQEENVYANFFAEIFSNINDVVTQGDGFEGDIVTTIEPTTQDMLEKSLGEIRSKWNSETAGGIIIDPKTGEIYAMALAPAFDPNNFRMENNVAVFSNDLVENVREMGSVIKPLTMAVAIDMGLANANTLYNDTGSITLNNRTIYNFDKVGRGTITLQEAMGKSLNTGFVWLSQKIGHDKFREYFTNFGLGDRTLIDLPNEAKGLIDNLNSPRDLEYATASFGQGIAMTPIATVRALSALANGGTLITPHVVKQIRYKVGLPKNISYPEGKRVISKETSEAISAILVEDYDTYFQDGKAKNPRYTIAEKTGTAQIALPGGGGYYEDRNLHSFFGYLPAYDPKFLVFLYTVAPQGVRYSSESLGPTFVDITKFLINYYQIPPDR